MNHLALGIHRAWIGPWNFTIEVHTYVHALHGAILNHYNVWLPIEHRHYVAKRHVSGLTLSDGRVLKIKP